ncbi:uncharacterized protein LOC121880096 [Homarus americanus]|uniref:uncharacterized protein LOC121880096 n=1 Tax=Homarus americanus TaxID=6706 RepID=UPI001C495CC2|nr:uncharacterized protein LOC121880096 [Homarus americanus]
MVGGGERVYGTLGKWRQLLTYLVLMLLCLANAAVANKILDRIQNDFGDYYKILNYAMTNTSDFIKFNVTSPCECRNWCFVYSACHSVSVMPQANGVRECRISSEPTNIGDRSQRPKLKKTSGAIHFLAAVSGTRDWDTLLDDGFRWRTESTSYIWSYRLSSARLAILSSLHQVKLAMRDTTVNKPYYVDLSRNDTDQPVWNAGGGNVKYNDTDLDPTRIQDDPNLSSSKFYFIHDGSQYTFVGTSGSTERIHLQQYNYLNLWE